MKNLIGNVWDNIEDFDALLVPTNGYVNKNGEAVMGRGLALQAKQLYPETPTTLGTFLSINQRRFKGDKSEPWNVPYLLGLLECDTFIFSFPVKPTFIISDEKNLHVIKQYRNTPAGKCLPGWQSIADIKLIARSAELISQVVEKYKFKNVLVPKPGCGNGELLWRNVKPVLKEYFDDRYTIIDKK